MPLDAELDPHFEEAARLNNLDPNLLRALTLVESSGNNFGPDGQPLRSGKGAQGIAQFIPSTAKQYGVDVNDPVSGIYGAARLLNDNLTEAEKRRAGGRDDIVPVDYALKMYFAGDNEGTPKWGTDTKNYPGLIAKRYQQLTGNQQPAPSGVDKLASVTMQPKDAPDTGGALALDYEAGRKLMALPSQAEIGPPPDRAKAPVNNGIDALAQVRDPQQQTAQAAGGPSDDEILKMLRQVYPTSKATPDVLDSGQSVKGLSPRGTPIVDVGAGKEIPLGGPSARAPAPASAPGPQPAISIQGFIDTYNQYRNFPGGAALANSALQAIMRAAPEGYEPMADGSIRLREGMTAGEYGKATAKAAGEGLKEFAPGGGVRNIEGNVASDTEKAAAVEKGKEQAKADVANQNELVEGTVDLGDGNGRQKVTLPRGIMQALGNKAIIESARTQGQAGPDGVPAQGPKLSGTPVTTPGEAEGQKGMAAKGTDALDAAHQGELAANRRTQVYGQMAEAMQGFTPGATAEIRQRADRILKDTLGIGIFGEGGREVPAAEIFQQAGKHLQITAQPKGQGQVSNFERELFAQAVPNMTNSPEGLMQAIAIGKRLDDYDRQVAQIHRDVAKENKGLPNYIEAQQRIATLGPPLSSGELGALERLRPADGAAAPAATGGPSEADRAAAAAELRRRGLLK